MVNSKQFWTTTCCALAVATASCTSTDDESSATASRATASSEPQGVEPTGPATTDSAANSTSTTATTMPAASASTTSSGTLPEAPPLPRRGDEIGVGSVGPPIDLAQPWELNTIYTDLEPHTLIVEFTPPNPDCIAAKASATIGRSGAVLVSLWVEGNRTEGPCAESGERNQVRVPLAEPLGQRRIYTSTVVDTQGTSERAELVADSIIDLPADEAIDLIRREGFAVRDLTDLDEAESDFNPDRINIWIIDGVIDFAAVF